MRYLFILLLFACNPVKKVMNDPAKYKKVTDAFVLSGGCANDTVTVEVVKDTVIYRDSVVKEFYNVPCKDFDTTFGDTRISVSSGVLRYVHTCPKCDVKIIKQTNTIVDRTLEKVLRASIVTKDSIISSYIKVIAERDATISELKKKNRWMTIKMGAAFALFIVILFRKFLIRLI